MCAKCVFQIIAHNGEPWLEPMLETIKPFGKVIATEGTVGYFAQQGIKTSTDRTLTILRDMIGTENVVTGTFTEKDEMMNAAIHLIPDDTTHIWMVDCDEIYLPSDIEFVLKTLDGWDSVSFIPNTFFGGFDYILSGFETRFTWYRIQRWHKGARWQTHRPPTILAPDGTPYRNQRHLRSSIHFFHYSYVMPSLVKQKIEYYASRGTIIPNYFNDVFIAWCLGDAETRRVIEIKWRGVHEWLPVRRGDCYAVPFGGEHPPVIANRMPELKTRFAKELAECQSQLS